MKHNFDFDYYLLTNSDLRHLSEKDAYLHYINFGIKEGRVGFKHINQITNITIILHLFNTNLFNEMLLYIKSVKKIFSIINIIITVNINIDKETITNISELLPESIIIKVENKGVDVYPFILSIKYLREKKIKTDFILKLHTKESLNFAENFNNWRRELIEPIVNYKNLLVLQNYFVKLDNIGYVSSQKCILPKNYDLDFPANIEGINKICEEFPHLEKDWTDFNGGNIFWISNKVIEQYLTENLINYLIPKFMIGKPPCNSQDKGIYIEYLCERLFTGIFCFDKTNIVINEYLCTERGISLDLKYFYQPKVFSLINPKYINKINII